MGISEVLTITPEVRQLVGANAPTDAFHAAAVADGMVDLKRCASVPLTKGHTIVEAVTSVVAVHE